MASRVLYELFVGEKPILDFEIVKDSDGTPIGDITGYTVAIVIKQGSTDLGGSVTMSITDAPNSKVRATFGAAIATGKEGNYQAQIKLTSPGSTTIRYTEKFDINVSTPIS